MAYGLVELLRIDVSSLNVERVWGLTPHPSLQKLWTVLRTPADTPGDKFVYIDLAGQLTVQETDGDSGIIAPLLFKKDTQDIVINGFGQCCQTGYTYAGHIILYNIQDMTYQRFLDTTTGVSNPNLDNNYGRCMYCPESDVLICQGSQGGNLIKYFKLTDILNGQFNPVHLRTYPTNTGAIHPQLYTIDDYIYGIAGSHVAGTVTPKMFKALIDDVINAGDLADLTSLPSYQDIWTGASSDELVFDVHPGQALLRGKAIARMQLSGDAQPMFYLIDFLNGQMTNLGITALNVKNDPSMWTVAYGRFIAIDDQATVHVLDENGNELGTASLGNISDYTSPNGYHAIAIHGNLIHIIDFTTNEYVLYGLTDVNGNLPTLLINGNIVEVYDALTGNKIDYSLLVSVFRCGNHMDIHPNAQQVATTNGQYDLTTIINSNPNKLITVHLYEQTGGVA